MNILVLSWRDHKHPLAGGAEQVMREHIRGWIKAGHRVTLFSSRFRNSREHELSDGIDIYHAGDQYIGVKINAFEFWMRNGKKFDLVVDQFHGIPFFTPLYIRKPKLAVLQEVAREVWFLNGFPIPFNYTIGLIGFILEPFIFPFYRGIHFMVGSDSAKKDLLKVGIPNKFINIIPHGVIIHKLKKIPEKEKIKTVIFLGALTKDKGIEDAIRTFAVLNSIGNYKFWIIGTGEPSYVSRLNSLTKRLRVGDKTKYWGFVSQKQKFKLLKKAHVLINPSVREGWGLVNIEANAAGLPVISYKSPGLVDSVKDGKSGIFCKVNSPYEMGFIVNELLSDGNRYRRFSKGAVKWATGFDWESSKEKSLALIKKVARLKNE